MWCKVLSVKQTYRKMLFINSQTFFYNTSSQFEHKITFLEGLAGGLQNLDIAYEFISNDFKIDVSGNI